MTAQESDQGLAAGLALAFFGAIAFSGKAIIVKLAYRHGVDAVVIAGIYVFSRAGRT